MTIRIVAILLALAPAGAVSAEPLAEHVILISIDGFRPDFDRDQTWPAPTLQYMKAKGAHAEGVLSVFPSVTYPAHTTIMTGVAPARHGIVYNNPFEPEGQTGRWYWEANAIQAPTLWDVLQAEGRKTAAVSWPVTVGAPIDWAIPEVWDPSPSSEDRLKPMRDAARPAGLWNEIQLEATGNLNSRTYSGSYMSRDLETGAAAAHLFETQRPHFMALHLIGTDHFQHEEGREGTKSKRALAVADAAISAIMEAVERAGALETTTFVVTGDHGFVDTHTQLAPNVLLAEAGLTGTASDRGEWRASFHAMGGAAFLHLKDDSDTELVPKIHAMLEALDPKYRRLFTIVDRKAMDALGAAPEARLGLAAELGVAFTADATGDLHRAGAGGTHGYLPDAFPEIHTGFVAWGAGIREGITVHRMNLTDIAPLVGELLNVPFETSEGATPKGILISRK